jgi:tctex1 domain-containing protein 2
VNSRFLCQFVVNARDRKLFVSRMIKQQVRFQNSYRLESKNPFKRDVVEVILKKVMEKHFSSFERFDSKVSVSLCRTVTEDVIELIKEKNFDR